MDKRHIVIGVDRGYTGFGSIQKSHTFYPYAHLNQLAMITSCILSCNIFPNIKHNVININ